MSRFTVLYNDNNPRRFSCYILQCYNGKFYVGSTLTHKVQRRFEMHRDGTGSKWCRIYKPMRILHVIENLTSREAFKREDTECVRIMREHDDIHICRGGSYNFPPDTDWWYKDFKDGAKGWIAAH